MIKPHRENPKGGSVHHLFKELHCNALELSQRHIPLLNLLQHQWLHNACMLLHHIGCTKLLGPLAHHHH